MPTPLPAPACKPRRPALRTWLAACALATAGAVQAQQPEARWLDAATRAQPAVVKTLESLVAIETGSLDVAGLARMADLLEQRLKDLGMRTERRKATAGAGADIVVGTLTGTGTRRVMLQAHMDTVYPTGTLQSQPMRTEGNRLYGPGIADAKGGIAVILHGLQLLVDAGWKDYAQITVLFNPDEEVGSVGSGEIIATLAEQHDTVLSFEPTAAKEIARTEGLLLGAAGTATAVLEVRGRASHAGAAPDLGRNAIIEIAHQLLQTRDVAKAIPGAQLNWTNVVSNKASNQIPDLAVARGDVRITVPGAQDRLEAALREKIAASKLVPDTEVTLRLTTGRPAFLAGPAGRALGERAQAIYRELGRELQLVPMTGGGTDAGYAGRSGKATVVESFGLAGWGYHARDEYIELDSIVPRLYLFARLMTSPAR